MMFLTRLSLPAAVAMAVVVVMASAASTTSALDDSQVAPAQPGPNDVTGQVVDKSGSGVANAQVWAIGGPWHEPETAAAATSDGQGHFILRGVRDHASTKKASRPLELFASPETAGPAGPTRFDPI